LGARRLKLREKGEGWSPGSGICGSSADIEVAGLKRVDHAHGCTQPDRAVFEVADDMSLIHSATVPGPNSSVKPAHNRDGKCTLQVIADYAGHTLVLDPAISGSGAFQYDCVPWPVILQNIAKNHGLTIRVESRRIMVSQL